MGGVTIQSEEYTIENKPYVFSLVQIPKRIRDDGRIKKEEWVVKLQIKNTVATQAKWFSNKNDALTYYNTRREKLVQKEVVL